MYCSAGGFGLIPTNHSAPGVRNPYAKQDGKDLYVPALVTLLDDTYVSVAACIGH